MKQLFDCGFDAGEGFGSTGEGERYARPPSALKKLARSSFDFSPPLSGFSVAVVYFRPLSNSSSSASNALRPRKDLKKVPNLADVRGGEQPYSKDDFGGEELVADA
jgi:hypothetical protein